MTTASRLTNSKETTMRSMSLRLLGVMIPAFIAAPAAAQKDVFRDLDTYIDKARQDWGIAGLAVAIVRHDSVVYAKGFGVRDVAKPNQVDERTLFAIGSNSKSFTALAMGMLQDEGKLTLDDHAMQYLPEFAVSDPYITRELTLRDLMTHRSGFFRGDAVWMGSGFSRDDVLRRADGDLGQRPLEHGQLRRDHLRNPDLPGLDPLGHVLAHQQRALAGVPVLLVEVHDLDPIHRNSGAAEDPSLDGGGGDVLVFHFGRRLHFDQRVAGARLEQDVHRHEDAAGEERCFEDRRRAGVECRLCRGHPLGHRRVRQIDQDAARELISRKLADDHPLIEQILQDLVHLQFPGSRFVDLPPEELVALHAGYEPGLGEPEGRGQ